MCRYELNDFENEMHEAEVAKRLESATVREILEIVGHVARNGAYNDGKGELNPYWVDAQMERALNLLNMPGFLLPNKFEIMEGDTFHTLEEFGNFPWDQVDPNHDGVGYGGIFAGHDCNPRKPTFKFLREDASADIWAIPDNFADLLESYRKRGKDDLRIEIRRILQVDPGF